MVTTKKPTAALVVKKAPTKRATVLKVTKTKEQVQQTDVKKVAKKAEPKAKVARTKTVTQTGLGVASVVKEIVAQLPKNVNVKKIMNGKAEAIAIPVGKVRAGDALKADKGTVKVTKVVAAEKPLTVAERFARRKPALKTVGKPQPMNITLKVKDIDRQIKSMLTTVYTDPACLGLPSKQTFAVMATLYSELESRYFVNEEAIKKHSATIVKAVAAAKFYSEKPPYYVKSVEEELVFLATYLTVSLTTASLTLEQNMEKAFLKELAKARKTAVNPAESTSSSK